MRALQERVGALFVFLCGSASRRSDVGGGGLGVRPKIEHSRSGVLLDGRKPPASAPDCQFKPLIVLRGPATSGAMLHRLARVLAAVPEADVLISIPAGANPIGAMLSSIAALNPRIKLSLPPRAWCRRSGTPDGAAAFAGRYGTIVEMDTIESYDAFDLPRLLSALEGQDLVIGSRTLAEREATASITRHLGSRLLSRVIRWLARIPVRDCLSGLLCWRGDFVRTVVTHCMARTNRGGRLERILLAYRAGARIQEQAVVYFQPSKDTPQPRRRGGLRDLFHLWRLAYRTRRGPSPNVGASRPAPRRKLLVNALGGIGDTILAIAMMRELRRRCPHDHITALAMWPQSAELLTDLGVFDEVLQHNFQQSSCRKSLRIVARLRRRRFDVSILCFPANRFEYNVVQWLIHARQRIGHDYLRGLNVTYLRCLLTHRVKQRLGTHNIVENLRLLDCLAPKARTAHVEPDVSLGPIAPAYRHSAERILGSAGSPVLGIHAGSSTYKNLDGKRWPVARFIELCQLAVSQKITPVLFGTEQDRPVNRAIKEQCWEAQIVEASSIRLTAALIQRCDAFVSNDSALAHLASAMHVPTAMITGPTDVLEVGPFSTNGCGISAALTCSPCFRVSRQPLKCVHPDRFACMKTTTVEDVWRAIQPVFVRSQPTKRPMPAKRNGMKSAVSQAVHLLPDVGRHGDAKDSVLKAAQPDTATKAGPESGEMAA